jgi:hypothetical protein
MTIVTCVKVRDGLVLGTDSMAHIFRGGAFGRAFLNARKLFQIGELPIGVVAYGLANVGNRSIESLMREFGDNLNPNTRKVETVARSLYAFMKAEYESHPEELPEGAEQTSLGIAIAGYSPGKVFAEQFEFELPGSEEAVPGLVEEEFGAAWWGVAAPFFRLSKGYGPLVRMRLEEAGLEPKAASALLDDLQIDVFFDAMPLQDAVDYASFVLKTTIDYTTFTTQVPPCGGPLQVATILPDRGFQWLAKPQLRLKGD